MADTEPNQLGLYIASEVARAEQDYQNVRSRSLNLMTVSGGLVALVTGLLTVAAGTVKSVIPSNARWTVATAMGAFILSTVCALKINWPQNVESSEETKLNELIDNSWTASGWDKSIATYLVVYLTSLRTDNDSSAVWLKVSIVLQILGIAGLGTATFLILNHAG